MLEGSMFKAYGKGLIQTIFKANRDKEWDGYYAVSDKFGSRGIPAIRPEDVADAKRVVRATDTGVFRGRAYYQEMAA